MAPMRYPCLTVLILVIFIWGASVEPATSSERKHCNITKVVVRAMEDDWWMVSSSEEQLTEALAEVFAGDLLEEMVGTIYPFVAEPQGIHQKVTASCHRVFAISDKAIVFSKLGLYERDLFDVNKVDTGVGMFFLTKNQESWYIEKMKLEWNKSR